MSDSDLALLIRACADPAPPTLVVADENVGALPSNPFAQALLLSNRFDVCAAACAAHWPCEFSDFAFATELRPQRALYRLSKEKRVVEHVLQSLWAMLPPGGELQLAGYKTEGIKTFARRAAEAWQCEHGLERERGQLHRYRFVKTGTVATPLNADDYHALRVIGDWRGQPLWSKPGIFAWDRIDQGSRFLLDHLEAFLGEGDRGRDSALDLGCGHGILALALQQVGCARVVGTDNNAAAVRACEFNLAQQAGPGEQDVIAADCGEGIGERFDLVVCNPPFHQGFGVEQDLTSRFLAAAASLLKPRGRALFVVNSFIPLERKAAAHFPAITTVADNRQYKLVTLGKA